ncbi:hypothetical protein HanXRQr2_Chr09g0363671 [Helianthus annuus]|uniref:Uncharacterized protein n=1 Tax=Helianthus annuus TaxID=4232 RepID=A0A9K3I2F0_HELAN|nr:hypothetical protein HanXRQr2_Chr09g0363671 [Helianthus annuus]KAJ0891205.1 hypothetical protein HanPSC8_Chr09g0350851 [Helianthus annuus]
MINTHVEACLKKGTAKLRGSDLPEIMVARWVAGHNLPSTILATPSSPKKTFEIIIA